MQNPHALKKQIEKLEKDNARLQDVNKKLRADLAKAKPVAKKKATKKVAKKASKKVAKKVAVKK